MKSYNLQSVKNLLNEKKYRELTLIVNDIKDRDVYDKEDMDILNYLYKNSELQISYNYNMVAIVNRAPVTLGVVGILDAYVNHQKDVVTKRTEFDLNFARKRMHIVEGLIKAISILDEVIALIRKSANKSSAKVNLQEQFSFTEPQAEYIVMLQLYRLTNSDIEDFKNEYLNLNVMKIFIKRS